MLRLSSAVFRPLEGLSDAPGLKQDMLRGVCTLMETSEAATSSSWTVVGVCSR